MAQAGARTPVGFFKGYFTPSAPALDSIPAPTPLPLKRSATAGAGCGKQDGGKIKKVTECTLDSCGPGKPCGDPRCPCVRCDISCPMLTAKAYPNNACASRVEIKTFSQLGKFFMAPPKGFKYSGGGTYPKAGDQYLLCGPGINPLVIGILGPSKKRSIFDSKFDEGIDIKPKEIQTGRSIRG